MPICIIFHDWLCQSNNPYFLEEKQGGGRLVNFFYAWNFGAASGLLKAFENRLQEEGGASGVRSLLSFPKFMPDKWSCKSELRTRQEEAYR